MAKEDEAGYSKKDARHKAYKWLSEQMGTDIKLTHIGMFDVEQCKQVIEICKSYYHEPPPIYYRHNK
jgi:hypothetical protein